MVEGDTLTWGKVSHPLNPHVCYDKKEWEEPGYLKGLKALQEDTRNNFSYLVPMNRVGIDLW